MAFCARDHSICVRAGGILFAPFFPKMGSKFFQKPPFPPKKNSFWFLPVEKADLEKTSVHNSCRSSLSLSLASVQLRVRVPLSPKNQKAALSQKIVRHSHTSTVRCFYFLTSPHSSHPIKNARMEFWFSFHHDPQILLLHRHIPPIIFSAAFGWQLASRGR